jgi:hypothetical protein
MYLHCCACTVVPIHICYIGGGEAGSGLFILGVTSYCLMFSALGESCGLSHEVLLLLLLHYYAYITHTCEDSVLTSTLFVH